MLTNKQRWLDALLAYRADCNDRHWQRNLYQLCSSHGLLLLQRRYGKELSSHDVEDVLQSAALSLFEVARRRVIDDPIVYFFVVCFHKANELLGGVQDATQEEATARIGALQEGAIDAETACALIESVGALLRAGGSLRREQRFAFKRLPLELMTSCCGYLSTRAKNLRELAATTSLERPAPFEVEREQLESARVGLLAWSMESDFTLHQSIALLDHELEGIALLLRSKAPLAPDTKLDQFVLSDEVLAEFLGEGEHDELLQDAVKGSRETSGFVQQLLADARFVLMPRSLAARRMERLFTLQDEQDDLDQTQDKASESPTQAAYHPAITGLPIVLPRTPASAAWSAPLFSEESQREVMLGKIPTHDAHLSFLAEVDSPVLLVHQGEQQLLGVSFGGQTVARKTSRTWEIALGRWPKPDEMIRATFQFQDSPSIEEEFCFLEKLAPPPIQS